MSIVCLIITLTIQKIFQFHPVVYGLQAKLQQEECYKIIVLRNIIYADVRSHSNQLRNLEAAGLAL